MMCFQCDIGGRATETKYQFSSLFCYGLAFKFLIVIRVIHQSKEFRFRRAVTPGIAVVNDLRDTVLQPDALDLAGR